MVRLQDDVKVYYGTKRVEAWPVKGREEDIDGSKFAADGYAVRYADGYISWSPKDVFEAAYKPVTAMDFSGALQAMRDGYNVTTGSMDEGEYIHIVNGESIEIVSPSDTKDQTWLPNESQLLATDWTIVE